MTGLLDGGGITGGVLPGKLGDGAVERDEFVGFEVALQAWMARHRGGDVLQ